MMKKEARNPDINSKPAVVTWFEKHPNAKAHFEPVIDFLLNAYSGVNFGFINRSKYPEFRFNSVKNKEVPVRIEVRQSHTLVRFKLNKNTVKRAFHDYHKSLANRDGTARFDYFDFTIAKSSDLEILSNFLEAHTIHNFAIKNRNTWRQYEVFTDSNQFQTIRVQSGELIEVSQEHLKLNQRFIRWLNKQGYKNIQSEFILANQDRIDVLFNLMDKTIFAELKTISGSSAKRAIREAIGQLLDYQYYDCNEKADELWIVVNDECTDIDCNFIDLLREIHQIPLRLIWEKNKRFSSFPK